MALSCNIELARFSARLTIQDGTECGKNKPKDVNVVENKIAVASYGEIWRDTVDYWSHFNQKDFLTGLVFGLGNNYEGDNYNILFYFSTFCLGPWH